MNCLKCQYLEINKEKLPYFCKKFGFKSSVYPFLQVQESLKMKCPFFVLKQKDKLNQKINILEGDKTNYEA